jgi:hypothetical protein|tara:strand:+ start:130 stop:378 length:249 start_codon:yes stop_codon:yes gene_type:complete
MKFNRKAFVESVTDTILGAAFNFPISWATLAILLMFTTDALFISVIQLTVLTVAAIIRRYCTRVYFEKRNNRQTIEQMARKK